MHTFAFNHKKKQSNRHMARKETNPIKTMMLVNTILIVAILGVIIFWPQKNTGDKSGRVLLGNNTAPSSSEPETELKTV